MNNNYRNDKKAKPIDKAIEFVVSEEDNEVELMTFLLANLKNKSRNNIKSLLKFKEVFVNKKAITQFNTVLFTGQRVTVSSAPNDEGEDFLEALPFPIIYEDDNLIVINKPAGLLSIATDKEKEVTAYRFLTEYVKQKNSQNRIFIIHRLDRDTSGILAVAKNEETKRLLQDNWEDVAITRGYTAVVEGVPEPQSGVVHSWLLETKTHVVYSGSTKGDGQEAITEYNTIRSNDEYSLLKIRLKTGRKNQIRVHMKDLNTPIIGDKKYGGDKNPIKRLGLHADLLEIKNPQTGEVLRFEAKAPKGFLSCTSKRETL